LINFNKEAVMKIGVAEKWINPSLEHLTAKYLHYRNLVDLLKEKKGSDHDLLNFCEKQLDEIRGLLDRRIKKVTLIWRLLHRVSEQLILTMDVEELAAHGHKILEDMKVAPVPDQVRNHWIEIVHERVKKLESSPADTRAEIKGETAQLFKAAANIINECIDDRFWDISVRKFFTLIYGILLLLTAFAILFFAWWLRDGQFCLTIYNIMLIGALGGLASGLITSEQEYMSKGHFWVPTIYYAMIRPTVGAVAAVVLFWMLEGHYLIQVTPPLENRCLETACETSYSAPAVLKKERDGSFSLVFQNISGGGKKPCSLRLEAEKLKKETPFKNMSGSPGEGKKGGESLVTLRTSEGKQIYLYLLILFFAGFSGDKILKTVSCRINTRLFAEAEKTKEAKK
jgi:hypothetical protein